MPDRRWQRLKALHERVFELPIEEARALVRRELADDPALAAELVSLLEQKLDGTRFLAFDDAPKRPPAFPPHHRLGDYELLHEIGRGGMGYVFMARHLPLDRDVALKVLTPDLSSRPEQVDRFRREAQRLAQFKHPGIVTIFDVQSIGPVHFFAMELVDGLDLHRELVCLRKQVDPKQGRASLPPADSKEFFRTVADIVRQAAVALGDAHQHQITHRDVKPHNLILGRDGRVRIVDFGIARDESMGRAGATDEASGTLWYMSPEQTRLTRRRVVDHRTDIYSLGVVMYELLTLQRPFDGRTQREILKAIDVREPKPVRSLNPRVPRDLEVICHTAMAKEPRDRYSDARALAADLERFLANEPIVAAPPNLLERVRRFLRRRRTAVTIVGVAVAAVAASLLLREALRSDPTRPDVRLVYTGPAEAAPRRISARAIDPLTERIAAPEDLGAWPLDSAELPLGPVRLRVEHASGAVMELDRVVRAEADDAIEIPPGKAFDPTDLVPVEGGTLSRRTGLPGSGCSLLDKDVVIEPFLLARHETTVGEYREFLRATGRAAPSTWSEQSADAALDRRPVTRISHGDMQAYAEWRGLRLPTHAELEWAARGADDRLTPNGAAIDRNLRAAIHGEPIAVNMSREAILNLWKAHTRDVGTSADDVTPGGIFDLLGNVSEATSSLFVDVRAIGQPRAVPDQYVWVGGAWFTNDPPTGLDLHGFDGFGTQGSLFVGFRCARSASP